jgi:hypothetical protein
VFCAMYLVFRWVAQRRVPLAEVRTLAILGMLAALYVIPQYLAATKTASTLPVSWPVIGSPGQTLGQLLFLNYVAPPEWWLVTAAIVGLVALRKLTGLHWLMAGGVFFAFLFVLAASYKNGLVSLLTNPWWNDAWRFAALVTITQVVLIGHGIVVVRDFLVGWVARRRPQLADGTVARGGVLVAIGLVLALVTGGLYVVPNKDAIKQAYGNGPTVNSNERAAMAQLRSLVPPGAVVMNDPVDGSPWMWALDGVRPLFGYPVVVPEDFPIIGPDRVLLYEQFDELDTNQKVRDLVRAANIQFVYVGSGFAAPSGKRAPGLAVLDGVRSLQKVYENADVRVYRVQL